MAEKSSANIGFEKRYDELVAEGDGFEDDPDAYLEENIFFVPEKARWSRIASAAHTPEIGTVIDPPPVVVLGVCSYRALVSYRHTATVVVSFLYMARSPMQTPGRWQK